jgi:hypothetical protein
MKKKLLKPVSAIAALSILLMTSVFATEARASEYIDNTTVGISKNGSTITVDYSITGTGNMSSIGASSIVIYKNGDPIHMFHYSESPSVYSSNVQYMVLTNSALITRHGNGSSARGFSGSGDQIYRFNYPVVSGLQGTIAVTVTYAAGSAVGDSKDYGPVYTINCSPISDLRTSDVFYHSSNVQYQGTAGDTYHAVVNFYAGNDAGAETRSRTTNSVTL